PITHDFVQRPARCYVSLIGSPVGRDKHAVGLAPVSDLRTHRGGDSRHRGEGTRRVSDCFPFLTCALIATAIPATMIMGSFLFATRPKSRTKQRMIPFESGVSEGPPRQDRRFTVSFYLTAMLFILFDIEIVFLYPLAIQLDALGWFGLVEFLTFIGILLVAYIYIWRKGALEWH